MNSQNGYISWDFQYFSYTRNALLKKKKRYFKKPKDSNINEIFQISAYPTIIATVKYNHLHRCTTTMSCYKLSGPFLWPACEVKPWIWLGFPRAIHVSTGIDPEALYVGVGRSGSEKWEKNRMLLRSSPLPPWWDQVSNGLTYRPLPKYNEAQLKLLLICVCWP